MAMIETSLEEIVRESRREGFLTKIGGPQFLAAQVFTILATILGVYLAGYVGFQRTLEYDRYTKAQQRSDLVIGIREELKQNIALLRKFNERLPAEAGTGLTGNEWPRLRLFVWQAAGRSSGAFDLPPQLLTDLQAFYEDIGDMLSDTEARQSFRGLTSSNIYFRTQYKQQLTAKLAYAEQTIVPLLEKTAAESEQLVSKYAPAEPASK